MYHARIVNILTSIFVGTTLGLVGYSQPGYSANMFEESIDSGSFDVGNFFDSAAGPLPVPQIDTIRGTSISGLDIDFYQLSLTDSFSDISVTVAGGRRGINLFNDAGQFLSPVEPVRDLSFSGEAGDTFFLAVDGAFPVVSDRSPLTLLGWDIGGRAAIQDVIGYEVSLQYSNGATAQVPEPMSVVALAFLGGVAWLHRQTTKNNL